LEEPEEGGGGGKKRKGERHGKESENDSLLAASEEAGDRAIRLTHETKERASPWYLPVLEVDSEINQQSHN
jgi:hypothetical protein